MFSTSPPGLTAAVPATSPAATSTSSSSSRSSRLRGLTYLRNYTQAHILSRDPSPPQGQSISQSRPQRPTAALARSASYPHGPGSRPVQSIASTFQGLNAVQEVSQDLHRTLAQPRAGQIEEGPATNAASSPDSTLSAPPGSKHMSLPTMASLARSRAVANGDTKAAAENLPSIRFSNYFDPRAPRPSLSFQPISRTLPTGSETIRVGRYSERDNVPQPPNTAPNASPVGFKSKVVSRRHCEFWYDDGRWYIRDVKSSSGTFLNHIRLSQAGMESRPFVVNDGDIVQLGIDFKGGEEMIFRCVKMRVELNRNWQNKPNTFNMSTHKRLRSMAASDSNSSSQDCSICLNGIAPCQSLFVAPCSHTWHYKCVRLLLSSPSYPIFICPNCRAAADLEAEVDEPAEEWEKIAQEPRNGEGSNTRGDVDSAGEENGDDARPGGDETLPPDGTVRIDQVDGLLTSEDLRQGCEQSPGQEPDQSQSQNPGPQKQRQSDVQSRRLTIRQGATPLTIRGRDGARTPSPGAAANGAGEGPITPKNDVGPWVFDGSAGAGSQERSDGMRSLNEAAAVDVDEESLGDDER